MINLERQKALYDYLLQNGNNWKTQLDIAIDSKLFYYTEEDLIDFHNSNCRKQITAIIREINSNPDFEKIIISNGNGVKIATEEDYDKMIKSLYRAVFAKLKRIKTIEKKAKRNGQITIDKKEIISFLENDNG